MFLLEPKMLKDKKLWAIALESELEGIFETYWRHLLNISEKVSIAFRPEAQDIQVSDGDGASTSEFLTNPKLYQSVISQNSTFHFKILRFLESSKIRVLWTPAKYNKSMKDLHELIETPFMLEILVKVLPTLAKTIVQENEYKAYFYEQVENHNQKVGRETEKSALKAEEDKLFIISGWEIEKCWYFIKSKMASYPPPNMLDDLTVKDWELIKAKTTPNPE
jgi:hypothetical protein